MSCGGNLVKAGCSIILLAILLPLLAIAVAAVL